MGFSWQECWNGLPCPPPGDLSDPGLALVSLTSALAGRFFTANVTRDGCPFNRFVFSFLTATLLGEGSSFNQTLSTVSFPWCSFLGANWFPSLSFGPFTVSAFVALNVGLHLPIWIFPAFHSDNCPLPLYWSHTLTFHGLGLQLSFVLGSCFKVLLLPWLLGVSHFGLCDTILQSSPILLSSFPGSLNICLELDLGPSKILFPEYFNKRLYRMPAWSPVWILSWETALCLNVKCQTQLPSISSQLSPHLKC